MVENKSIVITNVIPVTLKIMDYNLTGSNYLEWSRIVKLYLHSIDKDDHMFDKELEHEGSKKS